MVTICITIPHEIKELMKNVDNKSGLIAELIEKHFMKGKSIEALELERKRLHEKLESKNNEISTQIEIFNKQTNTEIDKEVKKKKRNKDSEKLRKAILKEVDDETRQVAKGSIGS